MKKITLNEFIERTRKIHGKKYDYSKSNYINSSLKIDIICPIHGIFNQSPNCHIIKKQGCPKCGFEKGHQKISSNINTFIEKSNKIHKNEFDYSKFIYVNSHTKGEIICLKHGSFFQTPGNHIGLKQKCPKCARNITLSYIIGNTQKFINKAKQIHGNKYDYSTTNYERNNKPVEIICKIHGSFFQTPNNHLNGTECPICKIGYKISKPQTKFLDYLKITNQNIRLNEWKKKTIDGYDPKTNTVYEFLGDYYHGNPDKYSPNDYNQICHKTFGELHKQTFDKFTKLKELGYNVKYIWESDWKKFEKKDTNLLNIIDF